MKSSDKFGNVIFLVLGLFAIGVGSGSILIPIGVLFLIMFFESAYL